jgi:TRAP transporter 4TM/12TM fusion protein
MGATAADAPPAVGLAEHIEHGQRPLSSGWAWLVAVVAAGWSLFQLAVAQVWLVDSAIVRSVHLSCGLLLVWLCTPALRRDGILGRRLVGVPVLRLLTREGRPGISDLILGLMAVAAAVYPVLDRSGLAARAGLPSLMDLTVGSILLVLLLEATRRSLGPALVLVAIGFLTFTTCSELLPTRLAFASPSWSKLIDRIAVSDNGIFGTPLDVVSSTVFLFVLFGAMLERSGAGAWFIDLALSLVGRYRGGAAKAAVLASGLSGTVSGSSVANVVTTGPFTIPLMRRSGYDVDRAGAIEVAASTNGQLMPPVMGAAAFLIAEYCGLTYWQVVSAAAIPAVLSYAALFWIVHGEACRMGLRGLPAAELPRLLPTIRRGLPYLLPLLVLLWALVVERWSPRQAGFWGILSLIVVQLVRALLAPGTWKGALATWLREMWGGLVDGGRTMAPIAVAVGCAGIIVGVVTLGLGGVIVEAITWLSGGHLVPLLLLTAATCIVLGVGLPTTATYIVTATLVSPVIVQLAPEGGLVIPLVAAHLFVLYFGVLADSTPPVGLAAYAAAAISGGNPIRTGWRGFTYDVRTGVMPFAFIANPELLLVGIDDWWHAILVIACCAIGVFAFASATLGWLRGPLAWWGRLMLLAGCILLIWPRVLEYAALSRHAGWPAGLLLLALVLAIQIARHRSTPMTSDS